MLVFLNKTFVTSPNLGGWPMGFLGGFLPQKEINILQVSIFLQKYNVRNYIAQQMSLLTVFHVPDRNLLLPSYSLFSPQKQDDSITSLPPPLLCQGSNIKSTCFRAHANNCSALRNEIKRHIALLSGSVDYTLSGRVSLRHVLPP